MSIQEQIEALTQELDTTKRNGTEWVWYFDGELIRQAYPWNDKDYAKSITLYSLIHSTNKAEVEEYADCYRRLKLYQLLGKKAEREFPIDWSNWDQVKYSTWFFTDDTSQEEDEQGIQESNIRYACLGSVWFAREEDRLEALRICGIDAEFQKRCAKYGLGGA